MELRDCGLTEAVRFIALGMELGYTFGDLNNTFEVVNDDDCLYRAQRFSQRDLLFFDFIE